MTAEFREFLCVWLEEIDEGVKQHNEVEIIGPLMVQKHAIKKFLGEPA